MYSGISTYGLMTKGREMNTLSTLLQSDMAQFTITPDVGLGCDV